MNDTLYKPLHEEDLVDATLVELESIPVGGSPYRYDLVRSGINLPKGWIIMFEMSRPGALEELVLVNQLSGQRLKLDFKPKYPKFSDIILQDHLRDIRYVSGRLYTPNRQDNGTILWHCVDKHNPSVEKQNIYTLSWGVRGLYFVKAGLFINTEVFPDKFLEETREDKFDPSGNYASDVEKVSNLLEQYNLGAAPATAKNVTAKPFGLDE